MRVYVAGKFEETQAVRAIQAKVRAAGHEITHDWTGEDPAGRQGEELALFLKECAEKDLFGVMSADALVLLNHDRAFGAMTEFGLAVASQIPVFVLKSEVRDNIFYNLGEDYGVYKIESEDKLMVELSNLQAAMEMFQAMLESTNAPITNGGGFIPN